MIYNRVFLFPALVILLTSVPRSENPALARRLALAVLAWGYIAGCVAAFCDAVWKSAYIWASLPFGNLLLALAVLLALLLQDGVPLKAGDRLPSEGAVHA